MKAVCGGDDRGYVCGMCGRPPGTQCPRVPPPAPTPKPRCYGCDGTGSWPKGTGQDCMMCAGTGEWSE